MTEQTPQSGPREQVWACCTSTIGPVCQHRAVHLDAGTRVTLTPTPYSAEGTTGVLVEPVTEGFYALVTIVTEDGSRFRTEGIATRHPVQHNGWAWECTVPTAYRPNGDHRDAYATCPVCERG